MLNSSLKSRFMQEFLAGLVEFKILAPYKINNMPKIKNVKNAFFYKILKIVKNGFCIRIVARGCITPRFQ